VARAAGLDPQPPLAVTLRRPSAPEDVYLATEGVVGAVFVAGVRLKPEGGAWVVDPTLPISPDLHGAAVVAAADGALVGRLLCEDESRVIVLNE
jgi:hypothetical protein